MSTVFFLHSILYAWMAWNLYHPNFHHQKGVNPELRFRPSYR